MKTKLIASLFLLSVFAQGCVVVSDDTPDSSLTIVNDSNYVMTELYITEAYDGTSWGPNLLAGGGPLFPDQEIIVDLDCGTYDVLVVDEDGYQCEYLDYSLCFDNDLWYVACGPPFTAASDTAANESTADTSK
ncbi:MAG TPA: hypothetical protein VNM90_19270 [Haliangium sp.]|nr:hypothetical protein [Haliangium sp.]